MNTSIEQRPSRAPSAGFSVTSWGIVLASVAILSSLYGCASLRGLPDEITSQEMTSLSATNLAHNLEISLAIEQRWRGDRNAAYDYISWSNASLIPFAAGGAGAALYRGSHDLVTGIALAAATVIGTNSFIGASGIGATYQSGITGMRCVYTRLNAYTDSVKITDADALRDQANELDKLLDPAQSSLRNATGIDLTAQQSTEEIKSNPTVVAVLANNEKILTQALDSAKTAITNARAERHLFDTLPAYARDRILDVNDIIAVRIKPQTVNYSALSSSLSNVAPAAPPAAVSGTPQQPKEPTKPAAPAGPANGDVAYALATPAPTVIADAAKDLKEKSEVLLKRLPPLVDGTSKFDLSTQENNIATCLKSL